MFTEYTGCIQRGPEYTYSVWKLEIEHRAAPTRMGVLERGLVHTCLEHHNHHHLDGDRRARGIGFAVDLEGSADLQ